MKKLILIYTFLVWITLPVLGQKIGVLMDSYVVERWMNDRNYISEKISELGGECMVEVANGEASKQFEQAKKLIEAGAQVLIIVPVDIEKAVEIAEYAESKSVAVIAYDRIIPSTATDLYLSFDNEMVGELQAKWAYENAGEGSYLLLNGPRSDYNAILFRKGQLKVLNPLVKKGKIKISDDIILDNWGELNAFLAMQEKSISMLESPVAIIAANDVLASGAISALSVDMDVKPIYITGQDAEIRAVRNLKQDLQDMTVYKPIKKLAYLAAESAMKLANGEKLTQVKNNKVAGVLVNSILLEPMVVTKDNYMETVVSDGHVTIDELVAEE